MKPIVVNAPPFDETSGGAIVLHYLVHRLRAMGVEAYACPFYQPLPYPPWYRPAPRRRCGVFMANLRHWNDVVSTFRTHPGMDVPIAPRSLLRQAIVVYPEIISGNPLGATNVVRWLLHKPGFFNSGAIFGPDELTYYFQPAFRDGLDWVDPENQLRLRWVRDDIYFDRGLPHRTGACRLIRKGAMSGSTAPEDDNAIPVDGLSHTEKAEVFNRTKYLYCHDPYTMYTLYAALCGCVPVVMPQPNLNREAWRASYPFKHGIAYGMEEADWAERTRHEMLGEFAAQKAEEQHMLERFHGNIQAHFRA